MPSQTLQLVKEFLLPGRHSAASIPPLDGGLTPNDGLDRLSAVRWGRIEAPNDVLGADGTLYVTTGRTLLRLNGPTFDRGATVAEFDGAAGPLARLATGEVAVGVSGQGVVAIDQHGDRRVVVDRADDGQPLHCVTAMAVRSDGALCLTDGSTRHRPEDWVFDLMQQNRAGRVLIHEPHTARTRVVASDLAFPAGICMTEDGDGLVVSEAWAHCLTTIDASGRCSVLRGNLPGYPSRIVQASGGGYWLAMFARRTLLVEFVLTQRDFVDEMTRTIHPDYWVRPALRTLDSGLEPVQGGQIRKLGVLKPWAPPRSYGLLVRLDTEGFPIASLHSRGGAKRHGVTGVADLGSAVAIAVQGGNEVLVAAKEDL